MDSESVVGTDSVVGVTVEAIIFVAIVSNLQDDSYIKDN